MKHFVVRKAEAKHIPEFSELFLSTPANLHDNAIVDYPTLEVLRASHGDKTVLYAPIQSVPLMESLAVSPDASELDVALALKEVVQALAVLAHSRGQREIYFPCGDERVNKFAAKHGFTEVDIKVYKLRL